MDRFPTLPEIATRVADDLRTPECDLRKVAETIALDPLLSSRVLQAACSPLFGARLERPSIMGAVVRLGTEETRTAVLTVAVMQAVPRLPEPLDVRQFWSFSLGTAICARHLALDLGFADAEQAYITGLVHCIGEAFLATVFSERFAGAWYRTEQESMTVEQSLGREFGLEPELLSALILERWLLPASIVEAVEYQQTPADAPDHPILALIVFTANRMCREFGLGTRRPVTDSTEWETRVPEEMQREIRELGYTNLESYLAANKDFLDEVVAFTRMMFRA